MAPAFSFAVVLAFLFAVSQAAELGKAQNQFRSFLNNELLAKAKAGYTPAADTIPGTELLMDTHFVSGGSLSVSKSFESSCTVPYQTHTLSTGSCILEGSVSYKFQMASADSCAGATIQYFYDDACTLYAGSSEISLASKGCHAASDNSKTYSSLSCSVDAAHTSAVVSPLVSAPSAEPTAAPSATPTLKNTQVVTVVVEQTLSGVSVDQYTANKDAYDTTIKQTVAQSMDGVSPDDVIINSVTAAPTGSVHALLRGVGMLTSSGIIVNYTIRVVTQYSADQLFAQLTVAVTDGSFNDNLAQNAADNDAPGLENATAEPPADVTPVYESDDEVSGGAAAAIAIGVVFGVLLLALVIYYFAFGPATKAPTEHVHTMVPVEL